MTVALRIARINYADNAIVDTGFQIGSLPASNLKDVDIQKIWRSTTTDSQHILADLGQAFEIGVVGLVNTNLDANDMTRVRVSNSDPTGITGELYDANNVLAAVDPVYGMWLHFIEPAVVGRYVRINLFNLSQVPEAGRLIIGPTWTPSHTFSFGWEPARQDRSRRDESLGGNVFVDRRQRQRVWRFMLRGLTEAEFDAELEPLNRLNGASQDILVCRDKDNANLGKVSVWGMLDEALTPSQPHRDFFEAEFVIRERL